jgi:hypothetical protein
MLYKTHIFINNFLTEFKIFFKKFYNYDNNIDELHKILESNLLSDEDKEYHSSIKILGKNDRNSIFNKQYHHYIDNNSSFNQTYFNFINNYIKPLFPNEEKLVIQKTPNLRISFPNLTAIGKREEENDDIVGLHKDSDFGHHFEEVNIIIPITNMYDSNSVYFEPQINSNKNFDEYINMKINVDQFFVGKLNKLRHYNKINKTNKTRISLDLRIIPYSKYIENLKDFEGTKFEVGKYFIII